MHCAQQAGKVIRLNLSINIPIAEDLKEAHMKDKTNGIHNRCNLWSFSNGLSRIVEIQNQMIFENVD